MPVVWHFKKWRNCERMRKKNKFLQSNAFNVSNLRLLGNFDK